MIENIIFDLGGVLIDWNPQYLYKKIIPDEEKRAYFLDNICTPEWNEYQDAGRSLAEGTQVLVDKHPQYRAEIEAYYGRWVEMLGGPINTTVDILNALYNSNKYPIYALTNWSHETFPVALERFDFLQLFTDIVVSGVEKMKKPAHEFYNLLLERHQLSPGSTLFIDDNSNNIKAARELGLKTIHCTNPDNLSDELKNRYSVIF